VTQIQSALGKAV